MKLVLIQHWTEYESGWGCRPDGASIHLDQEARAKFISDYKSHIKKIYGTTTPNEYSTPDHAPYIGEVKKSVYKKLLKLQKEDKHGIWIHSNIPPPYEVRTTYDNAKK